VICFELELAQPVELVTVTLKVIGDTVPARNLIDRVPAPAVIVPFWIVQA